MYRVGHLCYIFYKIKNKILCIIISIVQIKIYFKDKNLMNVVFVYW